MSARRRNVNSRYFAIIIIISPLLNINEIGGFGLDKTTLFILGIDPGTTTGICAIGLKGDILLTESRKGFSKSELLKVLSDLGNPLIVSSDTNPPPRMIEKIASAFSARLIVPDHSLLRSEKVGLVKRYMKSRDLKEPPWKNRHERDALASAIYAWKRVRALLMKIEKKLGENPDPRLSRHVHTQVIVMGKSINQSVKDFKDETG